MIRHLLKPLWKRKGRNLLLSLEIMLAFAVVFAIAAAGLRYWQLYHQPVGFEWQNVWSVEMQFPEVAGHENGIDPAVYAQVQRAVEQLPPVEKSALSAYTPYENSEWNTSYWLPDSHRKVDSNLMKVSDGFFDTMGVKVVEGRAFSVADDGAARKPVLVSRRFAQEAFPGRSAIGQRLAEEEYDGKSVKPGEEVEVVGVFDTFRNQGEYMSSSSTMLCTIAPSRSSRSSHCLPVGCQRQSSPSNSSRIVGFTALRNSCERRRAPSSRSSRVMWNSRLSWKSSPSKDSAGSSPANMRSGKGSSSEPRPENPGQSGNQLLLGFMRHCRAAARGRTRLTPCPTFASSAGSPPSPLPTWSAIRA